MTGTDKAGAVGRVVALGASNLLRGFQTLVSSARAEWGPGVEVLAALGHGRSYGARSRFLVRTLPAILECGLWRELESRPRRQTRALVTDVGNDILYDFSAPQILAWVQEALTRLRHHTADIVVTDLPLESIRRLSNPAFLMFRSILVPSCRLSLREVLDTAERVNVGLAELSVANRARYVHLNPGWYGLDPIHVRPSLWRPAWREILGVPAQIDSGRSRWESLSLYLMPPERRWLCGREQVTPQAGTALRSGGQVWLY